MNRNTVYHKNSYTQRKRERDDSCMHPAPLCYTLGSKKRRERNKKKIPNSHSHFPERFVQTYELKTQYYQPKSRFSKQESAALTTSPTVHTPTNLATTDRRTSRAPACQWPGERRRRSGSRQRAQSANLAPPELDSCPSAAGSGTSSKRG